MGDAISPTSPLPSPLPQFYPVSTGTNGKKRPFPEVFQKERQVGSSVDLRFKDISVKNHKNGQELLRKCALEGVKCDLVKIREELGKEAFAEAISSLICNFPTTEDSHLRLSAFLARLTHAFPELKEYIKANSVRVLLTKGVQYLVEHSSSIAVRSLCQVCDSRGEFIEKLKKQSEFPCAFLVRCTYMDNPSYHFTPFYVTKDKNGSFEFLNSDSTTNALFIYPFKTLDKDLNTPIKLICPSYSLKLGEKFEMFSRQQDKINCALFALHDVSYWLKNPKIAERIIHKAKSGKHFSNFLELPWYQFFPVRMMKTAQEYGLIDRLKEHTGEVPKEDWAYLKKKVSTGKQNWYIELKARKNIAKVVAYVLTR